MIQVNFIWKRFYFLIEFCYFLDSLNKYHQWTFDDQIPRSKIRYELSINAYTSILIIPDFDLDVDSGKYQCLSQNTFGITTRDINIDKKILKSIQKRYRKF